MPMQPGSFAAMMPTNEATLIRRIEDIERRLREMLPSVAASFGPVVADLQAKDAQILDLVSNSVAMGGGNADQTNITLTTADAPYAVVTVDVPSGFTQAGVLCTVTWMTRYTNQAGGGGYLYLKPSIGGTTGLERQMYVNLDTTGTLTTSFYLFMTGLSGSFTAAATARRSPTLNDPNFTNATVSVMAVFLR